MVIAADGADILFAAKGAFHCFPPQLNPRLLMLEFGYDFYFLTFLSSGHRRRDTTQSMRNSTR